MHRQKHCKGGNDRLFKYDAANGVITASCAVGISFALDYAVCKLNEYDTNTALKDSAINGLKTGSVVFASYVISAQITKQVQQMPWHRLQMRLPISWVKIHVRQF